MALKCWEDTGATAATEPISLAMAFASATWKDCEVVELPPGPRICPGMTINWLLPRLDICSVTLAVAPPPRVTILITAATPMTIPRTVRNERMTLRRISRSDSRSAFPIIRR
jgi:hypothetical protein